MIRRSLLLLVTIAAMLVSLTPAWADEFRPAYLQLNQTDTQSYDVLWKVPAIDEDQILKVRPDFPQGTIELSRPRSSYASGVVVQRWRIAAPGGLEGKPNNDRAPPDARRDV